MVNETASGVEPVGPDAAANRCETHSRSRHVAGIRLTRSRARRVKGGAHSRLGIGKRRRIVDENEVHIAGKIQLARAQLAHCQHGESTAPRRRRRVRQAQVAAIVSTTEQMRGGQTQGAVGKIGQRAGHLVQRPRTADIGRSPPPGPTARLAARISLATAARDSSGVTAPSRLSARSADRIRAFGADRQQRVRAAQGQLGQIGAVAAQAIEHRAETATVDLRKRLTQPPGGVAVARAWETGT